MNSHAWVGHARMAWTQTSLFKRVEIDVLGKYKNLDQAKLVSLWPAFAKRVSCRTIHWCDKKTTHIMLIISPHKEIQLQYTGAPSMEWSQKASISLPRVFTIINSKGTCVIARYISQKYTKKQDSTLIPIQFLKNQIARDPRTLVVCCH